MEVCRSREVARAKCVWAKFEDLSELSPILSYKLCQSSENICLIE